MVNFYLNKGECSRDEWLKALAKIGVTGFNDQKLLEIYTAYDANGDESLSYKEFIKGLYADEDEEEQKEETPKKGAKTNTGSFGAKKHRGNHDHGDETDEAKNLIQDSKVMEKFRERINARGGRGIIGLARQFKIFDDDNSKSLDLQEMTKAIRDFKVDVTNNEIKLLFQLMDTDGSGSINYDEFLREVRGEMNDFRVKLCERAYTLLDVDKSGVVDMDDIKQVYNCKKHPDVISGKKTEEEVYGEFIETFETHAAVRGVGTKDHTITREEFIEYYTNISSSIDNDEYFELMMKNAWKMDQPSYTKNKAWKGDSTETNKGISGKEIAMKNKYKAQYEGKSVSASAPWGTSGEKTNYTTSNNSSKKEYSSKGKGGSKEINKFREKLAARGTRGIMSIRRSFMIADDDNSKDIDFKEFRKLCKDYRIPLEENEIKSCFSEFDVDKSGTVNYDEFLRGIVGEMNDYRKTFVKKAFALLDKNGNGKIELDDIRGTYNASKHPDVKAGKKTEDEVLAEFLDTFEYHFNLLVSFFLNNLE